MVKKEVEKIDAKTKVAQYLNINSKYLTVDEWAFVYWVHVKGKRPTLLSKKLVNRSAQIQIGYTIGGDAIAKDEKTGRCFVMRQVKLVMNLQNGR